MTYEANIPRGRFKTIRTDDEIAEDAADEILWYAQNDKRKIYEIVLRAIWAAKHPPPEND